MWPMPRLHEARSSALGAWAAAVTRSPLTVRLTGHDAVISDDRALTRRLTRNQADDLWRAGISLWTPEAPSNSIPSATALAALAEAVQVLPAPNRRRIAAWPSGPSFINIRGQALSRSRPFSEVLLDRRSARSFRSCSLAELSTVLIRTHAVLSEGAAVNGDRTTYRPVPSAGGRHPFLLLVLALNVFEMERSAYAFDAHSRSLMPWLPPVDVGDVSRQIGDAGQFLTEPAAIVVPLADFNRTLSRYPGGQSLVWRDAGALALLLHLCATDLGLASCIVGTSGVISRGTQDSPVQDLGAVAIGRSARD